MMTDNIPHVNLNKLSVFLASAQDLEERKRFNELIVTINARDDINRNYEVEPHIWEQQGGPLLHNTINEKITSMAGFGSVVVLIIADRVGAGTLEEYETCKALRKEHGAWPNVFVYVKVKQDGVTKIGDESVENLCHRLVSDGLALPSHYRNFDELKQKFGDELAQFLNDVPIPDPSQGEQLRWRLVRSSALFFVFCLIAIVSMRIGVEQGYLFTLWVLFLPPLVSLGGLYLVWLFQRFMKEFRYAWKSSSYSDERMHRVFKYLIPTPSIPQPLRSKFPKDITGFVVTCLFGLLVLAAPIITIHNAFFKQFLVWTYVVSPEKTQDNVRIIADKPQIASRYLQRGLSLKNGFQATNPPFSQEREENPGRTVYVYHQGKMDKPWANKVYTTTNAYQANKGPEVFIPLQPIAYFLLYLFQWVSLGIVIASLGFLPRMLRPN